MALALLTTLARISVAVAFRRDLSHHIEVDNAISQGSSFLEVPPGSSSSEKFGELLSVKTFPQLGRFEKDFKLLGELASGGQANVFWGKTKTEPPRPVVFRFLKGLCDTQYCRVGELSSMSPSALQESHTSCELARAAHERYRQYQLLDIRWQHPSTPFAKCVQAVSTEDDDLAFDVWEDAGRVTMEQGFFMESNLGVLSMEKKRAVLRHLSYAVGVLGANAFGGNDKHPCCCPKGNNIQCTTERPTNVSFDVFRSRCPGAWIYNGEDSWVEKPEACGPIVHHDMKFDNVVLSSHMRNPNDESYILKKDEIAPTLIDFGAATRCNAKSVESFTQDWVPIWTKNPRQLPEDGKGCWSYDTYGVGLAWLATEILARLHPHHLACRVAHLRGLIPKGPREDGDCSLPDVLRPNSSFYDNELFKAALEPVSALVQQLHKFLQPHMLKSADVLQKEIRRFVGSEYSSSLPPELLAIPLASPPKDTLETEIFPLLRECPSLPSDVMTVSPKDTQATLECRYRAAARDVNLAISDKSLPRIAENSELLQRACDQMRSFQKRQAALTLEVPFVPSYGVFKDFMEGCKMGRVLTSDPEVLTMIINDDEISFAHFLDQQKDFHKRKYKRLNDDKALSGRNASIQDYFPNVTMWVTVAFLAGADKVKDLILALGGSFPDGVFGT